MTKIPNLPAISAESLLTSCREGLKVASTTTRASAANTSATRALMAFDLVFPQIAAEMEPEEEQISPEEVAAAEKGPEPAGAGISSNPEDRKEPDEAT